MNSILPFGFTLRMTCAEFAFSVSRSITPALADGFVFWMAVTRVMIVASPLSGWYTNRNESLEAHTSAPAPLTVKVPLEYDALPASPTAPISCDTHGLGRTAPATRRTRAVL